jgi:hypothetical protein
MMNFENSAGNRMILSVNHVGFSVKNIEDSLLFWTQILGGKLLR